MHWRVTWWLSYREERGGTARELIGKRKRKNELAQQPVRHLLWEQGSLEAHDEVLFGHLEGEVRASKQRKANYDETRRLHEGSDSCWIDSEGDSCNETAPELGTGPPALEDAMLVTALGDGGGRGTGSPAALCQGTNSA